MDPPLGSGWALKGIPERQTKDFPKLPHSPPHPGVFLQTQKANAVASHDHVRNARPSETTRKTNLRLRRVVKESMHMRRRRDTLKNRPIPVSSLTKTTEGN